MGLEHCTDQELEDIQGRNEGAAKAVLEAGKPAKMRNTSSGLIDLRCLGVAYKSLDDPPGPNTSHES